MQVIKNREIVEDSWRLLPDDWNGEDPGEGDIIVPLPLWQAHREKLLARNGGLGVRLEPGDEPEDILDDLERFGVVELHFPVFRDGCHYSNARLLRERHGYKGELRASGDVLRDQIFYMYRCGFDTFQPTNGHDIMDVREGLNDFTVKYQPATDESLPLFRRFPTG